MSLTKISQEELEQLVHTMSDIIQAIGVIDDEDVKKRLYDTVIDMCDQMKSRLQLLQFHKKKIDGVEISDRT